MVVAIGTIDIFLYLAHHYGTKATTQTHSRNFSLSINYT